MPIYTFSSDFKCTLIGFASFNGKDICKIVEKYCPADFTNQENIIPNVL
jgi:hypothetical protein